MKTKRTMTIALMLAMLVVVNGCIRPKGESAMAKKVYAMEMHDETLETLYNARVGARNKIAGAAGYGTFHNFGLKILIIGTNSGYGIMVNNGTGEKTYMKDFGVNLGLGMGDRI